MGRSFFPTTQTLVGMGLWYLSTLTHAADQHMNTAKIGSGAHLINVTLGLLLIVGIILAISWFAKRFSYGAFSANNYLKVVAAMPLGTRERILLIEACGQQLLIGITPTQINTLHVFDRTLTSSDDAPSFDEDTENTHGSEFGRKLMAMLQRTPNGSPTAVLRRDDQCHNSQDPSNSHQTDQTNFDNHSGERKS